VETPTPVSVVVDSSMAPVAAMMNVSITMIVATIAAFTVPQERDVPGQMKTSPAIMERPFLGLGFVTVRRTAMAAKMRRTAIN
jgi:hypothetical protein